MHIFILDVMVSKLKAFDTIGNQSKLRYKYEKPKLAVGHMLSVASHWLTIVCTCMLVLIAIIVVIIAQIYLLWTPNS